jgi:hypothetical protein
MAQFSLEVNRDVAQANWVHRSWALLFATLDDKQQSEHTYNFRKCLSEYSNFCSSTCVADEPLAYQFGLIRRA